MHLNPYGEDAVLLAVDLANARPESVAELQARCVASGLAAETRVTRHDLSAVHELLDRWLEVVDATDEARRARLLNALLEEFSAHPRLTDHIGTGWHLHYRPDRLPLGGVLAALVSVGTALHLVGRGMHRLRRCAAPDCDRVLADVTRNGRQRYCSVRCSNRDAVRRHRAGRRTGV
jgi:predicted RNA-binding Zn ribbon-like protein